VTQKINRLSARSIATLNRRGRHADGAGLYLSISYVGEVAIAFNEAKAHQWRNSKMRKQWLGPLNRYASRLLAMPINEIATDDVLAVLQPIWLTKPETAARVRARIEVVIDAARARALMPPNEANPARWRAHLSHLLPKRKKLTRGHHAALPYRETPAFIRKLREREGIAALALEFLILTASRTNEVLGAAWTEVDLKSQVWTVPATRMKSGREHRVPLSSRALEILEIMQQLRKGDFIFPRRKGDESLSCMAMTMCLRRMKIDDITVHGFRSTFRDWVGDATEFSRELAETALAHVAGDETERAYRRGDALERRRQLMEAWGQYVEPAREQAVERTGNDDGRTKYAQA
jgi:integrase